MRLSSENSVIRKIAFVIIFLGAQTVRSQNVDSLRHLIKTRSHEDTTYILALAELAYQFYGNHPDSCFRYANEADSLSKRIGYHKGSGRALRVLGIYYYIRSNYAKSLDYFKAAINSSLKAGDQNIIARCYGNIGVAISEQGNHGKALEYQLLSLKMGEQLGNSRIIVTASNSIGYIYMESGNHTKALEYFVSSLNLATEIKDKRLMATLYQNIAVIYHSEKKYSEALNYFQKALNILGDLNDMRTLIIVYGNLAETYIALKETTKALPYLDKAYEEAKKYEIVQTIGFIEEVYSKYYYAINDLNAAYRYASKSQAHAKKIGNLETWRDASKQKYLSAYGLGKHKEALENYDLFVRLRDSLKNEQINKKTISLEYELKEEKAKREQERKELLFVARQERQKRIMTVVGGIIFLVSIIWIYSFYRVWSDKTKKEMARIREKISRDIHDDMGSNLSTINILSGVAMETLSTAPNGPKTKDLLAKISIMSNLVMESIDEIVWSIDPHHDSFEQIIARMRALGGQLENQGIAFSFKIKGDLSKCTLNLEQRHDFYLIYKEAVSNIAKYAKCKNVVATLLIEPTQIFLCIKDDGIGFSVDFQTNGNGLRNMSSRARNLNGELKIVSAENRGTALELEFPVKRIASSLWKAVYEIFLHKSMFMLFR
jgi:signal transduction histidine kinase